MVIGLELVAGYAVAYLVRKWQRVAGRADAEVDVALDAGMDRLHEAVSGALGNDSALVKLKREAEAGTDNPLTVQRVQLAIQDTAESNTEFARQLTEMVHNLQASEEASNLPAGDHGIAVGGNAIFAADRGGVAGVVHGSVSTGNPPSPGPAQD